MARRFLFAIACQNSIFLWPIYFSQPWQLHYTSASSSSCSSGGLALYRWAWVAWLHVPAVVYAILIQTVGWPCPLTDLEKGFRSLAGQQPYTSEFLPHYLWSPLGLTGTEPMIAVGLVAVLLAINLRPYLGLAGG